MKWIDAILLYALLIFAAFSVLILFVSSWLRRKMCDNPRRDAYSYRECIWYIHPQRVSDRLAKRLITPSFLKLADYCNVTAIGFLSILVLSAFVLFLGGAR
ncbi:MAG: hypothetical protein EOM51_11850 [Clostridia bacterium]|nr:hypothetical protein [Clostridia bacterium]